MKIYDDSNKKQTSPDQPGNAETVNIENKPKRAGKKKKWNIKKLAGEKTAKKDDPPTVFDDPTEKLYIYEQPIERVTHNSATWAP